MAKPIHPAAKARAAKYGCEIIEIDNQFALKNVETGATSEDRFDKVAEATEALADEGIEGITWAEEDDDEFVGRSGVMQLDYHKQYSQNPHGPGCNDSIDITLRDETRELREDGTPTDRMDLDKLLEIVRATGLFREEWLRLNPGMVRMNSANRIRGWLRNNEGTITLGSQTGRFGVERREKKPRKSKKAATKV